MFPQEVDPKGGKQTIYRIRSYTVLTPACRAGDVVGRRHEEMAQQGELVVLESTFEMLIIDREISWLEVLPREKS